MKKKMEHLNAEEIKEKSTKTISEFKSFIAKGNVIDLAVGVIIGSAFGKIVSSIVDDIIMPVIGVIIGGIDFTNLSIKVGEATITYGTFIQNIIDIIEKNCDDIKLVKLNSEESKILGNKTFLVEKKIKKIICYPIERKILYCIAKISKQDKIVKDNNNKIEANKKEIQKLDNDIKDLEAKKAKLQEAVENVDLDKADGTKLTRTSDEKYAEKLVDGKVDKSKSYTEKDIRTAIMHFSKEIDGTPEKLQKAQNVYDMYSCIPESDKNSTMKRAVEIAYNYIKEHKTEE